MVDFNDEDEVLAEMAKELDIELDQLRISEDRGLRGFRTGTVYRIETSGGHKEWNVVEDDDQAEELALAIVKQDLEEEPGNFVQSWLEQHIDTKQLARDLEDDVMESNRDYARDIDADRFWKEYEEAGFDAPEEDEDGDRPDPEEEQIEELAESMTAEQLKDPMQYLEDIYGKEDAVKKAIEIAGFDIDEAAQDAVDTDGVGHFLSHYDGETYETKSGFVYWRVN